MSGPMSGEAYCNGELVADLHPCRGLLRGTVGGIVLHWYPDGRLTPARPTDHDLEFWEST